MRFFAALYALLVWWSPPTLGDTLRVAVAANFRPVLESLVVDFEARSGHTVQVIGGSTGKLYAQIVAGAPFDIFLAADQVRPARLVEDGLATARDTYAVGRLVLWDPRGREVNEARLRAGDYRRLALANPDLAPYGAAARAVLRSLDIEPTRSRRVAYAENVAQAFAFVYTGNADLGFIALSQLYALAPEQRGRHWAPPVDRYPAIRQDMVLLNESATARVFYEYLRGPDVLTRILQAGYEVD